MLGNLILYDESYVRTGLILTEEKLSKEARCSDRFDALSTQGARLGMISSDNERALHCSSRSNRGSNPEFIISG